MKMNQEDYTSVKENIENLVNIIGLETIKKYHRLIIYKHLYVSDSKVYLMFDLKNRCNAFKNINTYLYNDNHLTTALLKIGYELGIYEN